KILFSCSIPSAFVKITTFRHSKFPSLRHFTRFNLVVWNGSKTLLPRNTSSIIYATSSTENGQLGCIVDVPYESYLDLIVMCISAYNLGRNFDAARNDACGTG